MSSFDSPDVKGRTTGPGITLIITAVLNVLTSLVFIIFGLMFAAAAGTPEFNREFNKGIEREFEKNPNMSPQERKEAEAWAKWMKDMVGPGGTGGMIWGVLGLICSLVIGIGGGLMMGMRSYGLSMIAAILAILPCSSPCCLIGAIGGIWGISVMMNPDVKAAFR